MERKIRFLKILMITLALVFMTGTAHAGYTNITSSFEGTYHFTGTGFGGDFSYDVTFDIWQGDVDDPGLYQYRYIISNYQNSGTMDPRYFETFYIDYDANIYEVGAIGGTNEAPTSYGYGTLIYWSFSGMPGEGFEPGETSNALYFVTDGYPEGWFTSYGNVELGQAAGLLPGAAAPEPSTFLLLGIGVMGCFAGLRKRFKKQ